MPAPQPGRLVQPALSVVIPAFNCADLLARSVDSAYAFTDLSVEVLVVDDGSTDHTPAVCAGMVERYPALRVLRKQNGGLSSARNHGLDHAVGRYVVLLDADDELIPCRGLSQLTDGVDMLRLGVEEVTLGGETALHQQTVAPCSGKAYLAQCFGKRSFYTPSWAYLYRREWLAAQRLRFFDGLIHEDMLFSVQALLACASFAATPALAYRYFRRPGSITTAVDDDKLQRRVSSLATVAAQLMPLANQHRGVDLGWWILFVIDYAAILAAQSLRRQARWTVVLMEFRFAATYRVWGVYRRFRQVRFRLRKRLVEWWHPVVSKQRGVH